MAEEVKDALIICQGGLDSNQNHLMLSANKPGSATELVNFEPSLFGGYRRIDGFDYLEDTDDGEVAPSIAEGKIFGIGIRNSEIVCTRKLQSGTTYGFFQYSSGNTWPQLTTGLTHSSSGVDKVWSTQYNYDGTDGIMFTDGVNKATLYNGTSWTDIDPAATGADFANAGGAQALSAPTYCATWQNHLWMARCGNNCAMISHSAPNAEYDWTSASGAGMINTGVDIQQIRPFRDKLFIFGRDSIKYIYVTDGGDFAIKDVTADIGCIAPGSVLEVGGDLVFLGPDGIRPISATDRIGDFEIATLSKPIQQTIKDLIGTVSPNEIHGVSVRGKSQFRLFFSLESGLAAESKGIIGGLIQDQGGARWEFGTLLGIKVSCCASNYIDGQEYVLHGTHTGKVMRQETGNSFAGDNIYALYSTPYLDFGAPNYRKTNRTITMFAKPEGLMSVSVNLDFDWRTPDLIEPGTYAFEQSLTGTGYYGTITYDGGAVYGSIPIGVVDKNTQGSFFSEKLSFTSDDTNPSYSIQSILVSFTPRGRR